MDPEADTEADDTGLDPNDPFFVTTLVSGADNAGFTARETESYLYGEE